jgi:hypothetical protein
VDSNSPAGRHKVGPNDQSGDVDRDGEIVDLADELLRRTRETAAYERLARAVCTDEAAVDVDEHIARVLAVVRP